MAAIQLNDEVYKGAYERIMTKADFTQLQNLIFREKQIVAPNK